MLVEKAESKSEGWAKWVKVVKVTRSFNYKTDVIGYCIVHLKVIKTANLNTAFNTGKNLTPVW